MRWREEIHLDETIRKVSIYEDERLLSYKDVVLAWEDNPKFNQYFSELLGASPFEAYFWETPPVNAITISRNYEHVEVNSKLLAQLPVNSQPFSSYFKSVDEGDEVVSFDNLGGDAKLIAPCPYEDGPLFPHIAAFIRLAPEKQKQALWSRVGVEIKKKLSDNNMWVSTAGTGVAWLHVRLDSFPKYYTYPPYRECS